jgi:hypothetical protein
VRPPSTGRTAPLSRDHVAEFERGSRMPALGELLAEYVADVVERKLDILDGRSAGRETLHPPGKDLDE